MTILIQLILMVNHYEISDETSAVPATIIFPQWAHKQTKANTGCFPHWVRGYGPGKDDTLFPEDLALKIGIDLSNAPIEVHQSQGAARLIARFAEIKLRLTDGIEFREWPAKVGFVAGLRKSVLGFGGFLQFFTTTLRGDDEIVELELNRLYPGT